MERRPRRAKRALVKARCRASTALSRQGPFGLKIAALDSRSETLRRRSSRYRLPRVFHWTQTTHRRRRLIQPSSEANSRHWAEAEIAGPTPRVWDQLPDHPFQGDAPMPSRQCAHPMFEAGDGLVGNASPERPVIPHGEAEELPAPRLGNSTLLRVDLKLEAPFDEAGQALHDTPAGLFATNVDVAIICVAHEPVATTLKFAIQLVQHEVRKQGRERTALRDSLPTCLEEPVVEHAHRQVGPDEPEQPPIRDARRHRGDQPVVVDPVERGRWLMPLSRSRRSGV